MGVGAAIFESNGQRTEHYIPGVFSRSGSVSSPNGVNAGNHVVMGKSTGGKPFELLGFGSLAEAKEVLVGDELLNSVAYAFSGSKTYIPQKVYAMRVNDGDPSTLQLSSSETPILKLTSWDWGFHTNQLKLWLQRGTDENSKKLTISYKDKSNTVDNIVRPSITLSYTGEGNTATCSVTSTGVELSAQTAPEESKVIDNFTFSFEDYATVESMVTRINDTGKYVATLADNRINIPSKDLDTVSSVDIKTESKTLYSNLAALIDVLKSSQYIGDVAIVSESSRVVPDVTSGFEYFTGGSVGEYTVAEWAKALTELETKDVQIVSTPSTDDKVHALIAAHCVQMNTTTNKKERTCILGGPLNENDETALKKAKGFNTQFVSYVTDNVITNNPITGKTETVTGALLGVMLAGMESSMAVNEPLTNKALNVLGFSKTRTQPNMEKLLQGGVMVCNPSPDEPQLSIVIRALTTFQGNDLILNERSMVRENLYMNRDLRKRFGPAVGRPELGQINNKIQTLKDAARDWFTSGYIIPDDSNNNVWNIKVRVDGDKTYLDFDRYLVAPTNFIFINVTNHIYKASVAL